MTAYAIWLMLATLGALYWGWRVCVFILDYSFAMRSKQTLFELRRLIMWDDWNKGK